MPKNKKQLDESIESKGGNDECYTPAYGVRPILPFIPKGAVVWCPFDTEESEFVKLIRENGNIVYHSHIEEGKDFYTHEPPMPWDIIVSNPPFTGKREIIERALSFEKPFALIVSSNWFRDSAPIDFIIKYDKIQLLTIKGRINYINYKKGKNPNFASWYMCYDMLPERLVGVKLDKNPLPSLF